MGGGNVAANNWSTQRLGPPLQCQAMQLGRNSPAVSHCSLAVLFLPKCSPHATLTVFHQFLHQHFEVMTCQASPYPHLDALLQSILQIQLILLMFLYRKKQYPTIAPKVGKTGQVAPQQGQSFLHCDNQCSLILAVGDTSVWQMVGQQQHTPCMTRSTNWID